MNSLDYNQNENLEKKYADHNKPFIDNIIKGFTAE
jgi:hypothetical protein